MHARRALHLLLLFVLRRQHSQAADQLRLSLLEQPRRAHANQGRRRAAAVAALASLTALALAALLRFLRRSLRHLLPRLRRQQRQRRAHKIQRGRARAAAT